MEKAMMEEELSGQNEHVQAVAAALARQSLSRLEHLGWEDVAVDWSPRESVVAAAERFRAAWVGREGRNAGSTTSRRRSPVTVTSGDITSGNNGNKIAVTDAATGGVGAELNVSSLFPLPLPPPARFVKSGLYWDQSASARSQHDTHETEPRTASSSPPDVDDTSETAHSSISPPPTALAAAALIERSVSSSSASSRTESVLDASAVDIDAARAAAKTAIETACPEQAPTEGSAQDAASTFAGGKAATDCDSSSSARGDLLHQQNMTSAEFNRAYGAIFRNNSRRKRPRSPVVHTPLRLPFPKAPQAADESDENVRPPTGDAYPQTEAGSTWAWGLLDEEKGHRVPKVEQGEAAPSHRDFRLPYDVVYDVRRADFGRDVKRLGVRSADDALAEFQPISSNVYLSRKVGGSHPGAPKPEK